MCVAPPVHLLLHAQAANEQAAAADAPDHSYTLQVVRMVSLADADTQLPIVASALAYMAGLLLDCESLVCHPFSVGEAWKTGSSNTAWRHAVASATTAR
jgi:hypothetical protein